MIEYNSSVLDEKFMRIYAKYITKGNSPSIISSIEQLAKMGQPNAVAMWYEVKDPDMHNDEIDARVMSYEGRKVIPSEQNEKYTEYRNLTDCENRARPNLTPTQYLALTNYYKSLGDQISSDFYRERTVHSYIQIGEQSDNPIFYQSAYALLCDYDDEFLNNNTTRLRNIRRDIARAYKQKPDSTRLKFALAMNLITFDRYLPSFLNPNKDYDKGMQLLSEIASKKFSTNENEMDR